MAITPRDGKAGIIIVEDDPIFRYALEHTLAPHYEILAAVDDGAAALLAVEERYPDLIVMDVSLPILNGFDAARRILERHPAVAILFMPAHLDAASRAEVFQSGAAGYLPKTRIADLHNAIRAILDGQGYFPE
jgi:DNA-binding NarL/FixJ family response regulator